MTLMNKQQPQPTAKPTVVVADAESDHENLADLYQVRRQNDDANATTSQPTHVVVPSQQIPLVADSSTQKLLFGSLDQWTEDD